jgi:hypothetical protein
LLQAGVRSRTVEGLHEQNEIALVEGRETERVNLAVARVPADIAPLIEESHDARKTADLPRVHEGRAHVHTAQRRCLKRSQHRGDDRGGQSSVAAVAETSERVERVDNGRGNAGESARIIRVDERLLHGLRLEANVVELAVGQERARVTRDAGPFTHKHCGTSLRGACHRRGAAMYPGVEGRRAAREQSLEGPDRLSCVDDDARDSRLVARRHAVELCAVARHAVKRAVARRLGIARVLRLAAGQLSAERRELARIVERRHRAEDRLVLGLVVDEDLLCRVEAGAIHLDHAFERAEHLIVERIAPTVPHQEPGLPHVEQ